MTTFTNDTDAYIDLLIVDEGLPRDFLLFKGLEKGETREVSLSEMMKPGKKCNARYSWKIGVLVGIDENHVLFTDIKLEPSDDVMRMIAVKFRFKYVKDGEFQLVVEGAKETLIKRLLGIICMKGKETQYSDLNKAASRKWTTTVGEGAKLTYTVQVIKDDIIHQSRFRSRSSSNSAMDSYARERSLPTSHPGSLSEWRKNCRSLLKTELDTNRIVSFENMRERPHYPHSFSMSEYGQQMSSRGMDLNMTSLHPSSSSSQFHLESPRSSGGSPDDSIDRIDPGSSRKGVIDDTRMETSVSVSERTATNLQPYSVAPRAASKAATSSGSKKKKKVDFSDDDFKTVVPIKKTKKKEVSGKGKAAVVGKWGDDDTYETEVDEAEAYTHKVMKTVKGDDELSVLIKQAPDPVRQRPELTDCLDIKKEEALQTCDEFNSTMDHPSFDREGDEDHGNGEGTNDDCADKGDGKVDKEGVSNASSSVSIPKDGPTHEGRRGDKHMESGDVDAGCSKSSLPKDKGDEHVESVDVAGGGSESTVDKDNVEEEIMHDYLPSEDHEHEQADHLRRRRQDNTDEEHYVKTRGFETQMFTMQQNFMSCLAQQQQEYMAITLQEVERNPAFQTHIIYSFYFCFVIFLFVLSSSFLSMYSSRVS